ncbi:MAG: hypothetical protein ACKVOB_07935 [Sphingomonas sp.]
MAAAMRYAAGVKVTLAGAARILPGIAAVLAAMLALVPHAAIAQSRINNVAHGAWSGGDVESNLVSILVQPSDATLSVFRVDPQATTSVSVDPGSCQAISIAQNARAIAATAQVSLGVVATNAIRPGQPLVVRLFSLADNIDPTAIDTTVITFTTPAGDREQIRVRETAPDSGEFFGMIETRATPPSPIAGDCVLSVGGNERVTVQGFSGGADQRTLERVVNVLVDPAGTVFDSEDGSPVSGARVSVVDAATGLPARVFADDGVTPYPASVITGGTVVDGAGQTTLLAQGQYRFPLLSHGRYRLVIEPPAPYSSPSTAAPAALAKLTNSAGRLFLIGDGSFGGAFDVAGEEPITFDIPVDRPAIALALSKTASRAVAAPGDPVIYTVTVTNTDQARGKRDVVVTDDFPAQMRARADSVLIDGTAAGAAAQFSADGRKLTIAIGQLAPGATRTIRYALQLRADAAPGQALNRARVTDSRGTLAQASAVVRIDQETIAQRMTIVGKVEAGACTAQGATRPGVGGVRVILEDGSYAITDDDGRYHFEGVVPGDHVVQVDPSTLTPGGRFVDCTRSTRSAGSAISRFVSGAGGAVAIANFNALIPSRPAVTPPAGVDDSPLSDAAAAGSERDWFADGHADIAWLFPAPDHNPRAPSVRVAIRHLPAQTVRLLADGKPVDPVTVDGSRKSPAEDFAVSLWRGVPLVRGTTHLMAEVLAADGTLVARLARDVRFVETGARATLIANKSLPIADGVSRPRLSVRIVDSAGRPVHAGSIGGVALSAPYRLATEVDTDQVRQLSGLSRADSVWRVAGDDGVAHIDLAPTTVSGAVALTFTFREGDQVRTQRLETWLEPGKRDWTIVGLAQGQLTAAGLAGHIEPLADRPDKLRTKGRLAFYAKGRVRGSWLLTLAYDSAKRRDDQRLSGAIDPNTYYTVYADRSERRYDAASLSKLYVKLERRQFYALFGDFETGFNETVLGRYPRAATGGKAEFRSEHVSATVFAAELTSRHRRDEIQGNGLSGPYSLSARDIIANSEQVAIEVRDRLRSDRVVERRVLTRFADYDIDYTAGTIRFSEPILSRTSALDPQFLIVDFEVDQGGTGAINAGGRVRYSAAGGALLLGATAIHDAGDGASTNLVAADARVKFAADSELRGEVAVSRAEGAAPGAATSAAWLIEAEHHTRKIDLLAYVRQQDADFGIAQQQLAERGRRKFGADARLRITEQLSATVSGWLDNSLTDNRNRRALRVRAERKGKATDYFLGATYAADTLADGSAAQSTLLEGGTAHRLFGNRLELSASSSVSLGSANSVDFPSQYRVGGRFAITSWATIVGTYEIADGAGVDARTARVGVDLKPWLGSRITTSLGRQDITEYGLRSYAAYGLSQTLTLGGGWTADASFDGNRTLGGFDPARVNNPAQPVANGGFIGTRGAQTEDFNALTLGFGYRAGRFSATTRGEYRFGSLGDRAGFTFGAIRQVGDGTVFGGLATWARVTERGATTETANLALSGAFRPSSAQLALLGKLEFRRDQVTGATLGAAAPGAGRLLVNGNARSQRVIASLSAAWAPDGRDEDGAYQRHEVSVFFANRYVSERVDSLDVQGVSTLIGVDFRIGVGQHVELGASGSVRGELSRGAYRYAVGPVVGVRPAKNLLITAGWNFSGFADRDFSEARATRQGFFLATRLKFDQTSFGFLGLGKR